MQATNCPCQPDPLLQPGKNESKPCVSDTPHSPTKNSSGWWDRTSPNSASYPKYEEGLYPPIRCKTSLTLIQTSTPQCSGVSSTCSSKPCDEKTTCTQWRKGYLKKPLATYSGHAPHHRWPKQNDPLSRPHQATRRIGGRLTSTSHVKTGNNAPQNGSNKWMGGRWLGILKRTPQGISPLSLTYLPPRSTTITMTMTLQALCQGGFYWCWSGVVLPSPPSAT